MEEIERLKKQRAERDKKDRVRQLSSQQGIQVKTKVARGPNPLSVKKKQQKEQPKKPNEETAPKRKRIRKKKEKVA